MAKFGWCLDGHHAGVPDLAGRGDGCPGRTDGSTCVCICHSHENQDESTATQSPNPTHPGHGANGALRP